MHTREKQPRPLSPRDSISIGRLAERVGLSVSAVRFYEERGLLHAERNSGGHRRFRRADVRRLSFIRIAQQLGLTLDEIREALEQLPEARTPSPADWKHMSEAFRERIDARIEALQRTRDRLDTCIGCGCLSLKNCALYNPQDRMAANGPGPRFLLGDPVEAPDGSAPE